tara:strand:+ start:46 stop:543 length:498 start_codon:yes stop_codon:yes gene_type:complete
MRIEDNFLDKEEFDKLSSAIMGENFPWYYSDIITNKNDTNDKLYFVHHIYNSKRPGFLERTGASDWCNLFNKFLKKLNYKSLIRIKANLYIGTKKKVIHEAHKDFPYKHKGCILYMNDNNGETFFEKEKVKPKANRAIFFDPSVAHSSSSCTDQKRRVNINFNYF